MVVTNLYRCGIQTVTQYNFKMKQKDLNKMFNENEFGRLRDILFPKKTAKINQKVTPIPKPKQQERGTDVCIKDQIQKLRKEIYNKLQKERNVEEPQIETERLYLDGINKLSKNLKDYTREINQVFQDFLEHLPTNLTMQKKTYNNHYFVSLLIQNCVWSKLDNILKKPLIEGFKAISSENASIKEEKELEKSIKSKRLLREKNKNMLNTNKYFNIWRFQSKVIGMQTDCQQYRRQNCLQNDRKVLQNMLNFPFYVLLIEEINKENSDICQILLFDDKTKKLCKFIDENTQILNTSLQTVTQRSLLHGETTKNKIKRHEVDLNPSLTKLCIERRQILFVSNLLKHPDYHQTDSFCNWQLSEFNKREYLKGGVVFYPIIGSDHQIIGVLRHYFFEKSLKVLSTQKINKISMLLELGAEVEKQARKIANQSEILKQKYYLKMIFLIKKLESEKGSLDEIITILFEELKTNFQIEELTVFKVQKKQTKSKTDIFLNSLWGNNSQCTFLLSIVDKLLKQGSNYVYLEKRLIIYHNMMLFDLHIAQNTQRLKNGSWKYPVELLTATIGKIQTIITKKEEQYQGLKVLEIKRQENRLKQLENKFESQLQAQSLVFLSHYAEVQQPFKNIVDFVTNISQRYFSYFTNEDQKVNTIDCYLQVFEMEQKKMHLLLYNSSNTWQQQESGAKISQWTLKVKINEIISLFICCNSFPKELKQKLQHTILQFIKLFLEEKQRKNLQTTKFASFQTKAIDLLKSYRLPQHQLNQKTKSKWQLNQLKLIYRTFGSILQLFVSQLFSVSKPVLWQRQQPSSSTIQEWKQNIYLFVFTQPQKVDISIKGNQQNQVVKLQKQLNLLFQCGSTLIKSKDETFLQIYITKNKPKYKSLSYESPVVVKLPILCPFNGQNTQTQVENIKSSLSIIKLCWLKLCKSLIEGTSCIDEQSRRKNAMKLAHCIISRKTKAMQQALNKIRLTVNRRRQVESYINKIAMVINRSMSKSVWLGFAQLKGYNVIVKQERKFEKCNPRAFQTLIRVVSDKIFHFSFQTLRRFSFKTQSITQSFPILAKLLKQKCKEFKNHAFTQLFYRSKTTKRISLLISPLNQILKKTLDKNWQYILETINQTTPNQPSKQQIPELVRSIKQLKSIIQSQIPQYRLFLIIDSFHCIPLYSKTHSDNRIIALQEVNIACQPFLVYQIGSKGQFIWQYFLKEGQNSFKIKDKLSRLSNFIQQALKNCKELFLLNLLKLKCFRGKYFQFWKSRVFKKWRQQCEIIGIQQRNRLNDCLYQLNIEGQTTKQKLKMFEKMLKGNVQMLEQMKSKKEQYLNSIRFSESEVAIIEQSYDKLENARNMYTKLHKRTILKSCLLLWRSNSKKMAFLQKKNTKVILSYCKIASKCIVSIVQPKITKILRKTFQLLSKPKKPTLIKKSVEKINVSFDQNSRLITFQSQINQKQNQSQNSNSFDSPQGKKDTYRNLTKFKMNELKQSNKISDLSAQQISKYNNGVYKLNPKTLKFLKRMGKLQN